ncbi:MAG: hypothetical protein ACBR21_30605 [Microcoleus sp.]
MKIAVDGFDNFFSRSLCLSNYFNDAKGDRVLCRMVEDGGRSGKRALGSEMIPLPVVSE